MQGYITHTKCKDELSENSKDIRENSENTYFFVLCV